MTRLVDELATGQTWRRKEKDKYGYYRIIAVFDDIYDKRKIVIQRLRRKVGMRLGNRQPPKIVTPCYFCCFERVEHVEPDTAF